MQFQAVARLQVDHQPVAFAAVLRRIENGVRCRAKVHLDVRVAAGQPLAGADVKRHASPAPVGDFGAQGHKGFGAAVRIHARFMAVTRHGLAFYRASRVLATHHMLAQGFRRPGFERTQDLELFIANGVSVGVDGRLHRHRAQQLQRMVLHHVAQRAGAVIKRTALFHAEFFGNGDLDVGNMLAPPEWLEQ